MKKTPILCLILALLSLHAGAQSQSHGVLSVTLGPSVPVGDFAGTDANSETAALATIGALADLSYQHSFAGNSRLGWFASIRGRYNSVSKSGSLAPLQSQLPDYHWGTNSCHWLTVAAIAGGYYQWTLTPQLSLQANIGLGVAESWSPKQTITGVRDSVGFGPVDLIQASVKSVSATAVTAIGGLSLSYRLHGRWSLLAKADYMYLKPKFHNVTTTVVNAHHLIIPNNLSPSNASYVTVNTTTRDYEQPMSSVNISVGLGWAL